MSFKVDKENSMVNDPFCGMQVNPDKTAHKSVYQEQTYYFCSAVCKDMFEREPQKYAAAPAQNKGSKA